MLRLQRQLLSLLRTGSDSPLPSLHRLPYSTASTSTFSVDDYLVNSCGLTPAQVPRASRSLSHLKHRYNADAVLAFLSGLGLSRSDIAVVVAADPRLLCSRVDGTLAPRVAALRGLGLSDSNILSLALTSPALFRSCDIVRRVEFWIPILGSFDKFLWTIKRSEGIMRSSIDRVIKPNLAYLTWCGLDASDVGKLHLHGGRNVLTTTLEKLKELVRRADKLGIHRSSGQFKYALVSVSCISEDNMESKKETLKSSLGCTEEQLLVAVSKHPGVLRTSEDKLRSTMKFLITKVGLEPEYIVHRAALISYSLKGRLMPRYLVMKALQKKGIPVDYSSMVAATEKRFMLKYIECHKESVPGLADVYAAACAGEMPSELQYEN